MPDERPWLATGHLLVLIQQVTGRSWSPVWQALTLSKGCVATT